MTTINNSATLFNVYVSLFINFNKKRMKAKEMKTILEEKTFSDTLDTREEILRSTKCLCPSCGRVIPASVVKRDGYIYLVKSCIFESKKFESIIEKANLFWDERQYNLKHKLQYDVKLGQNKFDDSNIVNSQKSSSIFFLITQKCNANCPICFDKKWLTRGDMSSEFIKKKLKNVSSKSVFLSGGEPTVREDLIDIISLIEKSGNIPGIITNGIKLADKNYLKKLIKSGLKHVFFSFDGFEPSIYEELRGDASQYEKKLKALENLKEENISITILSVIVKGVNENQISKLVDYCCRNKFIRLLSLRYLNLHGVDETRNFNKQNLISREEIMFVISKSLDLSVRYFDLFYKMRCSFIKCVSSIFPNIEMDQPINCQIYLKREQGGTVSPVFTESELKELIDIFEKKHFIKLFKSKYLWWVFLFIKNRFQPALITQGMHENNIFSITAAKAPLMLSDYPLTGKISNIIYFPNALPVFAWYPD